MEPSQTDSVASPRRQRVAAGSLAFGSALLVFPATVILGGAIHFFAGCGLSRINAPLALVVSAASLWWFTRGGTRGARVAAIGALLLAVAVACVVASALYDLSWDGQDYHQKAIGMLADGWNPLSSPLEPDDYYRHVFLNHYPKGSWIAAASFFLVTGSLEAAKASNLLAAAAAFLLVLAFCLRDERLRAWQAVALAALTALNPISACQLFTNYVDGLVAATLASLVVAFLESARRPSPASLVALGAACVVGLNVKFTGTVYAGIFIACFALLALLGGRGRRKQLVALLVGAFLGVFVAGFQPYVTNLARNGNPLYPVAGASGFDSSWVAHSQAPPSFLARSRAAKLVVSLFARSNNDFSVPEVTTKLPFQVYRDELKAFGAPDVRFGGFGPLFAAALIVALVALAAAAALRRKAVAGAILLALLMIATTLLNPEPWWARYSPQLWGVPLIALALAWTSELRPLRILGAVLALLLVADAALVGGASLAAGVRTTRSVSRTLDRLAASGAETQVYVGPLEGTLRRLQDHRIRYRRVESAEDLSCRTALTPGTFYSAAPCDEAGRR